ncbi:MAG TPA: sugar-transfer associated ATP-grasp domain-containing protein [Thermoanaerobaculia bacterium]|nr:sugar-transfer associated ATP-grasp domain-containing protein [Thermoanaerobaculia bacterium]
MDIERYLSWVGYFLRRADRGVGWLGLLWAYRHGYLPQQVALYRLPNAEQEAYLSDRDWVRTLSRINGAYTVLLQNKLVLHRLLAGHRDHLPEVYGVLWRGRFLPEPGSGTDSLPGLLDRVERAGGGTGLVVKPVEGAFGRGIQMLRPAADEGDDAWTVNGQRLERRSLLDRLAAAAIAEPQLVSEIVHQAAYACGLYPHSSNSLRVVMMRDPASAEPFVAAAVQRVGVAASRPVDNFTAGGLSAPVHVASGEIGMALQRIGGDPPVRHAVHPETGAPIRGVLVPGWRDVQERLTSMMQTLPFIAYVGWDVLITEGGFKVLEGNANPDPNLQVHSPLLKDPRVLRFCRAHGVRRGGPRGS